MNTGDQYKEKIREKLLDNKKLAQFIDNLVESSPASTIYILFFIATAIYAGNFFRNSLEFSLFSLFIFSVIALLITVFFNVLNKKGIFKKVVTFLFSINRDRYGLLKGFAVSNFVTLLIYVFIFGAEAVFLFEPYFIYFYSIGYLFFNLELKPERLLKIKNTAFVLFILSIAIYLLNGQDDPLYTSAVVCFSPFLAASFFIKKINSLYLMYRTAFFILVFFISTTIFLHFSVIGLVFFLLGKLSFFIKYGSKYPSFYSVYDKG